MKNSSRFLTALFLAGALLWSSPAGAQLRQNADFIPEPLTLTDFKKVFNGDTGKVRLVLLFSPT